MFSLRSFFSCFLLVFCTFIRNFAGYYYMNHTMKAKKMMLLLAITAMGAVNAKAQYEVTAPQNVYARESMSLNGDWNYFVDQQEQGYYDYRMNVTRWGYFLNAKPQRPSDLVEYDFDACPTMHVPGDWNTQDEQLFWYEGTVWMKRDFEVKSEELRVKS